MHDPVSSFGVFQLVTGCIFAMRHPEAAVFGGTVDEATKFVGDFVDVWDIQNSHQVGIETVLGRPISYACQ